MRTMRQMFVVASVVVLSIATTACETTPESETTKLVLHKGSTLSVATDVDGNSRVEVVIPPGRSGVGTYVSTNSRLCEAGRWAMESLRDVGCTTTITVDSEGTLVAITQEVTKLPTKK